MKVPGGCLGGFQTEGSGIRVRAALAKALAHTRQYLMTRGPGSRDRVLPCRYAKRHRLTSSAVARGTLAEPELGQVGPDILD